MYNLVEIIFYLGGISDMFFQDILISIVLLLFVGYVNYKSIISRSKKMMDIVLNDEDN